MEILSLKCNNCGANLEVNPKITYFNCSFCKSSLAIKKTGNVIFTEVLGEIKENTDLMLVEKKIARLDREWMIKQKDFSLKGNDGNFYHPEESSKDSEILGGVLGVIFGFVWIIGALSMGAPGFFPIFGLVFIGTGIYSMVTKIEKRESYEKAKKDYENNRNNLLSQLDED